MRYRGEESDTDKIGVRESTRMVFLDSFMIRFHQGMQGLFSLTPSFVLTRTYGVIPHGVSRFPT